MATPSAKVLTPPKEQRLPVTLPLPSLLRPYLPSAQAEKGAENAEPLPAPPATCADVTSRSPYSAAPQQSDVRLPPASVWATLGAVILVVFMLNHLGKVEWVSAEVRIMEAQEALRKQNWPAALGSIQKVAGESREQPAFRRVLADYLEQTRSSPGTLADTLERLKQTDLFRPADHLWLCRAWLATRHIHRARAAWDEIPAPLSQGIETARLKVELLRAEGRLRVAEQAEAALAHYGEELPSQAVRQCVRDINQNTFPEVRLRAHERLWELARRQDEAGLDAIRMLSRQEGRTVKESADLLALVEEHPMAITSDRLALVSLLMRLAPARKADLIQAEMDRLAKNETQDVMALVDWLVQEKQTQLVQELRERLKLTPAQWFSLEARTLANQQQWQALLDLVIQHEHGLISRAELAHWQAVALLQLHPRDITKPHELLEESVRQAQKERNFFILGIDARVAEDWHLPELALKAYQTLAEPGSRQEISMLENAARIATELKNTNALAGFTGRLARLLPDNVLIQHRAAYLLLLRGEMLETAIGPSTTPDQADSSTWLLAALKAWRFGDIPTTRASLQHITETHGLSSGERAVLAGLLAKNNETARAFQLAEKIRPELLLPEEMTFLKMAL